MLRTLRLFMLALAGLIAAGASASAHPHVWVTMQAELVYDKDGAVTGVRHAWAFDDMFSVFATQGLDSKVKDQFTREELHPLAQTNVESLKEFDYFTVAKSNDTKVELGAPLSDYYLDWDAKETVLTLHFTLPFKQPLKTKDLVVEVFDPSYFVDFAFAAKQPAALVGAPGACKMTTQGPQEMDDAMIQRLAELPADAQLDPASWLGSQFANKIMVKCP